MGSRLPFPTRDRPTDRPPEEFPLHEVVEPGTRLVERYRLAERLDDTGGHEGTTYWRAEDELLARPVGICLIDVGTEADPRAGEVLAAARRAAALPDPRFLRVLDANRADGHVYVVSEWVAATDLAGLVADGPLPATEARALAADLAGAMSAAHDAGLAHLCLGPERVLRTAHGQLKLAGLAVDAAARGRTATGTGTDASKDVHGIGAILYAALTGRWPGEQATALPPAPMADDAVCTPRQVRAGVPHDLDEITCRALGLPARRTDAFRTPGELLSALESAGHTSRLPTLAREPVTELPDGTRGGAAAAYAGSDRAGEDGETRSRSRAVLAAWVLAAIVLVTGLSLFGGQVVMTALDGDDGQGRSAASGDGADDEEPPAQPVRRLDVRRVQSFDPPPAGDGEEHDEQASLVVDGDTSTGWTTMTYFDPLDLLKPGVGLVLDLGAPAEVSEVVIRPEGGPTDLEVRVAGDRPSALEGFTKFDRAGNASGRTTLRVTDPVRARYLLVWLTDLPRVGSDYIGRISEITVRGTPAAGG